MALSFTRKVNMSPGQRDTGDVIDAGDVNELQEALEDISLGTVPIPLAGISGALQSGGYTNGAGDITTAAITPALEGYGPLDRVVTDDNPADSMLVRDAAGVTQSVAPRYVYAEARGLVMGSLAAAGANSVVLQAILDAGDVALLPEGTCYYDTTLIPKTGSGIVGSGKGRTTLKYTGTADGIRGLKTDRASGIYRSVLREFTLLYEGASSGDGICLDVWRYSAMEAVEVRGFIGSGLSMDGVSATVTGCWSNRFVNCEFTQNGEHGIKVTGIDSNANVFVGVHTSRNALDGVYAEKARGWHWGIQAEGNGRHAIHLLGVRNADLSPVYIEHQDPNYMAADLKPPGVSVQSPRYCIEIDAAPDGSRCGVIVAHGAYLEGSYGDNGTFTNHIVHASHTDYLDVTDNDMANTYGQRMIVCESTVRYARTSPNRIDQLDPSLASSQDDMITALFDTTGAKIRASRGEVARNEGFANLLVNGGFDAWPTSPGVPPGWTSNGTGTYSREAGTDGGYRAVLTNIGTNQSGIYQDVTGIGVGAAAKLGRAVLAFDAIVPTTNQQDAQVFAGCYDASSTLVGGYVSSANAMERTDTERSYELQFAVPATTTRIRIIFMASRNGVSNTDVLKVDRAGLYVGWVPKGYDPQWVEKPVAPSAYTPTNVTTDRSYDANSTSLDELADVVGTLIGDLQAAGVIG